MGWMGGSRKESVVGVEALTGMPNLFQTFTAFGAATWPEQNFHTFADAGFSKNELVYACIMEKATSAPEAPLRVYGPDGLGEPREDHPLRQLVANPNPILTEFEQFELAVIHLDLAGLTAWEIVSDRAGRPAELWPLRPDLLRFLPGPNGSLRYGYVLGGRIIDLGADVITFRLPNPIDPYVGQAPMRAAMRAVALDNQATDFVKELLQNRAMPSVIVTTQEKLDQATTDRLRAGWRQSFSGANRGGVGFLQKGMTATPLGLSLEQLEFPDLRTISESRICAVLGVPPILIGAKVGLDRSTFANYREARVSLWEETLMPLQRRMKDVIVSKLLPRVNAGSFVRPRPVTVRFDRSEVLALKESEQARWERATQALRAGAITVADFRRQVGLPPLPNTDVFLRPAGVIPTLADGTPSGGAEPEPTRPDDGSDKFIGDMVDAYVRGWEESRGVAA